MSEKRKSRVPNYTVVKCTSVSAPICPYGDIYCPCPDGDPCHYEDKVSHPLPVPETSSAHD